MSKRFRQALSDDHTDQKDARGAFRCVPNGRVNTVDQSAPNPTNPQTIRDPGVRAKANELRNNLRSYQTSATDTNGLREAAERKADFARQQERRLCLAAD